MRDELYLETHRSIHTARHTGDKPLLYNLALEHISKHHKKKIYQRRCFAWILGDQLQFFDWTIKGGVCLNCSIRWYGGGGRRWGGGWRIGSVGVVMHIATHSGAKSFNCTQCDHSCTTTSHLRQHMLRHSEERHSAVSSVTVLTLKLVIWRGISSNKKTHCM